ncbi:molecular chaperone HscC [Burkholderia plantarii]|uniref:molecular chaperone HscC n=1 Tax=Burkholderia plantarii TaxID=41899 RepID=UPI000870878A|nr:molecular chaperone HscC [Burkholderia plantarii]
MIVGIDLGTTNSLVAVWENGQPRLVANSLGEFMTPSCVSLDEDGSVLVGRAARERLQTHPEKTAALFKRFMGSEHTVRLGRRHFRAEELSALILRSLKEDAEAALGQPVTEAIVTVPAYFSDAQRKATRAAGVMAGLKVDRLLNEPTAAALAYGIHQPGAETRFLVVDLGGGTFDVSVLEMFEGVMEVRATAGDNFLGGEDFVTSLIGHFFATTAAPAKLRDQAVFMQRLTARVEAAKRALSEQPRAEIRVTEGARSYALELDEATLESVCAPLLHRLRAPVERALRDASLNDADLDRIVLAGGATRMPIVRRLVARMFGRFPECSINPDEVVALGAAVQAGLLMKDAALDEVVMTDVASYSLGIDVVMPLPDGSHSRGHFDPIIERNSVVPVSRVKTYHPTSERQPMLEVHVYQGEARLVADNIPLGKLRIELPDLPRAQCGVDVRFTYDVNGLLQVDATVQATGHTTSLVIEGNPGVLGEEEIAASLAALSSLKVHPRDRMENRTLMARAERLYQQLRGAERERFGAQIRLFEVALNTQEPRRIEADRRAFSDVVEAVERWSQVLPPPQQGY